MLHNTSYYGLAMDSAKGGFPARRKGGGVSYGVDMLSLSLGSSARFGPNFHRDPIAIGSFHAVEKGIMVVCLAGNDGPNRESVVNIAPWILTVAATSIDRNFQADIILSDKTLVKFRENNSKVLW
ncbi:unnamed protein product [Lactuca saligna]|uniref:Peptidase S8/S53 domain-containing protein n=1 Tax=Lactuca saligna TaxID=75948 RepID=A0AA35UVK4_LACSI|nr:unnamed protein product [Lactuca saligna]